VGGVAISTYLLHSLATTSWNSVSTVLSSFLRRFFWDNKKFGQFTPAYLANTFLPREIFLVPQNFFSEHQRVEGLETSRMSYRTPRNDPICAKYSHRETCAKKDVEKIHVSKNSLICKNGTKFAVFETEQTNVRYPEICSHLWSFIAKHTELYGVELKTCWWLTPLL